VKTILRDLSKAVGIYRKRLLSGNKVHYIHKEFCKHVEGDDVEKLGEMLRILGFLTQKVYLIWANSI